MSESLQLPSVQSSQPIKPVLKTFPWLNLILTVGIILSYTFFLGAVGYYLYNRKNEWIAKPEALVVADVDDPVFEAAPNYLRVSTKLNAVGLNDGLLYQEQKVLGVSGLAGSKPAVDPSTYKLLASSEFVELYEKITPTLTGLSVIDSKPAIRGDDQADKVIQEIAEKRGYKLRYSGDESRLIAVDGSRLHPEAGSAWTTMKNAAAKEGITLTLVSGYRSIQDQKEIFLNATGSLVTADIIARKADTAINDVLITRSIPGYSKHHSGYTIDIACGDTGLTVFKDTPCYQWMSAYNYLNAKRFGFLPSYPKGLDNMGPDPEQWEYVWVGEPNIRR